MFFFFCANAGPHSMCGDPRREPIYFRGDCLYKSLFSLITPAKANKWVKQKGLEILRGIKSSSASEYKMQTAELLRTNSFQKSHSGTAGPKVIFKTELFHTASNGKGGKTLWPLYSISLMDVKMEPKLKVNVLNFRKRSIYRFCHSQYGNPFHLKTPPL